MKNSGFVGEIEGLSLVDIVQFACLSGDDRKLSVLSEDNVGVLFFSDNEIIHAEFGELTGEEAFYRIMSWSTGTFSMLFAKTTKRTIDSSWNFLLLEAARRIDEQNKVEVNEEDELPKVLVVDDSRFFTKAFVKLFEGQIKAKVVGTATNGKEAVKFLEMQVPDLITLDMTMPVMSGDVALKHIMIRSPAPVVLVSNFNEQIYVKMMDFMRYGAVDVVAKPVNPDSWKLISTRLRYILMNVKEFCVDNVSRAKLLKPVEHKPSAPSKPATRLILIMGGLGGLLELQKIIPFIEYQEDTAIMVLQNLYPGIDHYLAAYFQEFSAYTVTRLDPGPGNEMLGGQCQIGNCHGKREFVFKDGVPMLLGKNDDFNKMSLDADNLLRSAAEIFGTQMSLVILSGVDMDLKNGMETLVRKGGRIILQEPDSCLLPGPVQEIQSLSMEECCLRPEDIAPYLAGKIT